jgi:hypothetical protein
MKHLNVNNYKWNDGHGAFASGIAAGGDIYKLRTHIATRKQRLAQQQYQLAQARIQKKEVTIRTKEKYQNKTTSEKEAYKMVTEELGYDPSFLKTGDLQDLPGTNLAPTLTSSPPFASISVSNCNYGQSRNEKCVEFVQVAEASCTPTPFYGSNSLEYKLGQRHNLMLLTALGFVAGAGLYLIVVRKIRTLDWYKKNFSNQSALDYYNERLNTLENDQKQMLETQNKMLETQKKILELLTKNKP